MIRYALRFVLASRAVPVIPASAISPRLKDIMRIFDALAYIDEARFRHEYILRGLATRVYDTCQRFLRQITRRSRALWLFSLHFHTRQFIELGCYVLASLFPTTGLLDRLLLSIIGLSLISAGLPFDIVIGPLSFYSPLYIFAYAGSSSFADFDWLYELLIFYFRHIGTRGASFSFQEKRQFADFIIFDIEESRSQSARVAALQRRLAYISPHISIHTHRHFLRPLSEIYDFFTLPLIYSFLRCVLRSARFRHRRRFILFSLPWIDDITPYWWITSFTPLVQGYIIHHFLFRLPIAIAILPFTRPRSFRYHCRHPRAAASFI